MTVSIFAPVIAALLVWFTPRFQKGRAGWWMVMTALAFSCVKIAAMSAKSFFKAKVYSSFVAPFLTWGDVPYAWRLHFDRAELFLAVFVVFSAFLCLSAAKNYLPEEKTARFSAKTAGLVASFLIATGANDMFQFIIGWDLSVLFAYMLLTTFHDKQSVRRAGVRFFIAHKVTDIPLFAAFFMLWEKTGTFYIPPFVSPAFTAFGGTEAGMFAAFIISAAAAKLICFGMHFIMNDGAEMPVPAMALCFPAVLSGLGIYGLYHCFPFVRSVPNVRAVFVAIGALSSAAGVLSALNQTNIKTLLCFMLMSQFGFVTAAFGLAGEAVALYTFVAMAVPMIGLMLASGNVIYALWGEEDITRMGGLRKNKPVTFWMMWVLCFCCAGFPYTGTFGARRDMYSALFQADGRAYAFIFPLLSFAAAAAFARMMFYVFYAVDRIPVETAVKIRKAPLSAVWPLAVLTFASLFQDELLEQSILPPLTGGESVEVLLSALLGCGGFAAGIACFSNREKKGKRLSARMQKFSLFCSKGFFFLPLCRFLIVRPVLFAGKSLRLYADLGLIERRLADMMPAVVRKTAQIVKNVHSDGLGFSFFWSAAGLFLLFVLSAVLAAGG